MAAPSQRESARKPPRTKTLFTQISKGDLVTIRDEAGERRGHAARREYGNWVIVLERNRGAAVATRKNTVAVSKPGLTTRS